MIGIDATYNINKYKMPYLQFVTIDSYGRLILIAGAFLSNEKTETYVNIFHSFINMKFRIPNVVNVDRDLALTKAINKVFPKV